MIRRALIVLLALALAACQTVIICNASKDCRQSDNERLQGPFSDGDDRP